MNGRDVRGPGPNEDELELMRVLIKGVTDEDAAAALGWSRRTVLRRLRSAMDKLGARSRFQAGWLLARAKWLADREA